MMEHWGNPIWRLFHVMVEKIDETEFRKNKILIIDLINYIGCNLPCIFCTEHYKRSNYICHGDVFHKNGLKILLWEIHNRVNTSKHTPQFKINIIKQYEELDILDVMNDFYEKIYIYDCMDMDFIKKKFNNIKFK
jgi:hypothetical protein